MHVVRNVLLRPVFSTHCCRGVSTAATHSVTVPEPLRPNVSDRQSPGPDALANEPGFERFKKFTRPHLTSTVSKGKKKKPKQKFKAHTRLMTKSRDATVLHKGLASCLIQTLQSMESPTKQAPVGNSVQTKKKQKKEKSASSRRGCGADGWAKEGWGIDGQHCLLRYLWLQRC